MKIKIISEIVTRVMEEKINQFLIDEVEKLIDIKFNVGITKFHALIIYEEKPERNDNEENT